MGDIKNNWNKYRNSRADIENTTNCLKLLGGGGMHLIEWAKQDSQEIRRLEKWVSAFCIKYMYQLIN